MGLAGDDAPACLAALAATPPDWLAQHRAVLPDLLVHRGASVRAACAALFRAHDPAAALAALSDRLSADPFCDERIDDEWAFAIDGLGLLGDAAARPALEAHLLARQARARQAAARALQALSHPQERIRAGQGRYRALHALIERDEDAILALGESGSLRLAETLRDRGCLWPYHYGRAVALWGRSGYAPRDPWERTIGAFFSGDGAGLRRPSWSPHPARRAPWTCSRRP